MHYMRYQLATVNSPSTTPPDQVLDKLSVPLQPHLNGTGNLAGHTIAKNGNTISIPGDSSRIKLDASGASTFRATITDWAGEIVVKTDGGYGDTQGASRAISMDFTRQEHTTTTFDYAVASKGRIVMSKGMVSTVAGVDPKIATMMSGLNSAGAITVTGGTIGGELSVLAGSSASVTGGSVAGSSIPSYILSHYVHTVEPPDWPTFDTTVFKPYATNTYTSGAPLNNIRIPPGTNPKFTGNKTIQGILYIESPNNVEFRGNVTLQGFIVFENKGTDSQNVLDFRGNVAQLPLPNGSAYDALRATSGVAILAPTAAVTMSGSTDSILRGNVIVNTFNFAGSADIQIDRGTLMGMKETGNTVVFNGKTVKFTATGKGNAPNMGVTYGTFFAPDPTSYQEVTP
jgi:hypothetical protein